MTLLKLSGFKGIVALFVFAALVGISLVHHTPVVSAHPLGNFTINHYSRIELTADTISLRYILDMAEIPAFQEISRIDLNKDGQLSDQERADYLERKPAELQQEVDLLINGSPVALALVERELTFPAGQGGLSTLRLNLRFLGDLPQSKRGNNQVLEYRDESYSQRIGWREIVVKAGDGITLVESTVPQADVSKELQAYPSDLAGSPLDQRYARATFAFAGADVTRDIESPEIGNESSAPSDDLLSSLITRNDLSLSLLAISLMVALGLGALHAMSPGHGKTIMAAYLVGTRGTAVHALFLGLTVTVSHTLGVVVLGLVVLYASHLIAPETLYPWLSMASGVVIVAIGLGLLVNRLRSGRADNEHGHPHHHHRPGSHHSHYAPLAEVGKESASRLRITWRSLAALGVVGGLVPSTSALVILLAAISVQRIEVGLLLVLTFSVGMALVLGGVGLALVYAAKAVERVSFGRGWMVGITRQVSLIAAAVVLVSGVVMMARGLHQLGVG
jgi:ABC-type nickel/cobalt efflux system permease component RcnA